MLKRTIILLKIIILIIFLFASDAFSNNNIMEIFNQANSLYNQANYEGALELYLKLDEIGIKNADLYYNIANTYMKKKDIQIGKAILYYNRALHYKNGDSAILKNLNLARNFVISDIYNIVDEKEDNIFHKIFLSLYYTFNINTLTILVIVLSFIFSISLLFYFISMKKHKILFRISIFVCVVLVIFLSILFFRIYFELFIDYGVVITDNSKVFSAPSEKQQVLFVLSEGVEVEIKDIASDEWFLISLPNGLSGYIKTDNIEQIKNFW